MKMLSSVEISIDLFVLIEIISLQSQDPTTYTSFNLSTAHSNLVSSNRVVLANGFITVTDKYCLARKLNVYF